MDPKEKKVKEEELNVEETHNPAEDQPQNEQAEGTAPLTHCLLYTSPSPRDS